MSPGLKFNNESTQAAKAGDFEPVSPFFIVIGPTKKSFGVVGAPPRSGGGCRTYGGFARLRNRTGSQA